MGQRMIAISERARNTASPFFHNPRLGLNEPRDWEPASPLKDSRSYCNGEYAVGSKILAPATFTSGPPTSVSRFAACHSGSAMKASHAR